MEIEGLNDLIKTLDNSPGEFEKEANRIINVVGLKLLKKVKLKTPVDTGALRRSWQGTKGNLSFTVSNNTEYGPYVEYGHRVGKTNKVVDGRYMLTKSVKEIEKELENGLETMIENLWK